MVPAAHGTPQRTKYPPAAHGGAGGCPEGVVTPWNHSWSRVLAGTCGHVKRGVHDKAGLLAGLVIP